MSVTLKYRLSEAGRKASLLAGGSAEGVQSMVVGRDSADFAAAVAVADVNSSGVATIDCSSYRWHDFDSPPSAADVIALPAKRKADEAAKATAEFEDLRARTQAVLDGKQATERSERERGVEYKRMEAVWPSSSYPAYTKCAAVIESDAAKAWVAELDAANAEAKRVAELEADAKEAAAKVEADAKAAKVAAFRTELSLAHGEVVFPIESGCLARVPCWESHKRGKNWLAAIEIGPRSPGGLDRTFAEKCKGDLFYDASGLTPGTAVEFGADYYSGAGRKNADRWYGYVVRNVVYRQGTDDEKKYVVMVQCDTGKQAIKAAAKVPMQEAMTNAEGGIIDTTLDRINNPSAN